VSDKYRGIFILAVFFCGLLLATGELKAAFLSPSLEKQTKNDIDIPADSLVPLVVFFADDTDIAAVARSPRMGRLPAVLRHKKVIDALRTKNRDAAARISDHIRRIYPDAGIKEFWIAPAVALDFPAAELASLFAIEGIEAVYEDGSLEYMAPVDISMADKSAAAVSDHLNSLNIPELWSRGLTGHGRLVCSFDTGIEGAHPALSDKWRGHSAGATAAWFAPASDDTLPFDRSGHGTHTMGLMVGSNATDTFGVAPDAEWIGAAVIDQGQTLDKTISDILEAFQWAADPDGDPETSHDVPDVILNSWGVPTSIMDPCDETFYQVIDNVEAAGIVTIFAAGNEGPDPYTLRIPANRATSPLNSFAVGAIDGTTNIVADFSSRGPSSCDAGQIKPEVVAPGVALYSCTKNGEYTIKSGTSMAAPLIAGLVVLLREFNPEATVDEIKMAIIKSARDLGAPGEDNEYGHGLPDAELALLNMPGFNRPKIVLDGLTIGGDGNADPGQEFDLFVRLRSTEASLDSLMAELKCLDDRVTIVDGEAHFIFLAKDGLSTNLDPFVICFNNDIMHGETIRFDLSFCFSRDLGCDSLDFEVMAGRIPDGRMHTHVTSRVRLTVTDFGQFGLGPNSIYPAGGEGFRFDDSEDLLYEGGIIVGRSEVQQSSAVRDSSGSAVTDDFRTTIPLETQFPGRLGGFTSHSRFVDSNSMVPIPITIAQAVTSFEEPDQGGYLIIDYDIINNRHESLNNLYFGFLTDFDLSAPGEQLSLAENELICQVGAAGAVGLCPLTELSGALSLENTDGKIGLTRQQKFDYITTAGININDSAAGDFMTILTYGPFSLAPFDSARISLALLGGSDRDELEIQAAMARARFYGFTDVDDDAGGQLSPTDFILHQNAPNPFNPATTIDFDLPTAAEVELNVYNILGEKVRTLTAGIKNAGRHRVTWDGRDRNGRPAATGVYFYELKTGSERQTRKMLLVK